MSEPISSGAGNLGHEQATGGAPTTAGGLLRQARQAQGLHIAALASSIKVTPQKLELLEADRFDELPGAAFTRALAQTVCRTLKIDAGPVLALLPSYVDKGLERMSRGLDEPFRDKPGRQPPADFSFLKNPVRLGAVALIVLAVAVYVLPSNWIGERLRFGRVATPAPAASEPSSTIVSEIISDAAVPPSGPDVSPSAEGGIVHSAPAEPAVGLATPAVAASASAASTSASAQATPSAPGELQLHATSASWVVVTDRHGTALFSRRLQAGETVALDGAPPLRLKIGNASATQVTYKGERIDLSATASRGNVAKLELK